MPEICLLSDVFRCTGYRQALEGAARAGFTSVELNASCHWDPHLDLRRPAWKTDVAAIRSVARACDLRIPVIACYPNLAATDPRERAGAVLYCRRAVQACGELGGRLITLKAGGNNLLPLQPQRAVLLEALAAVCRDAAAAGVGVAIESYPGNCVEGTTDILDLIRELGCANLGYLLCTAHLAAQGEDLRQACRLAGPLLRHVHLSDTRVGTPSHQHLLPGLGDVDIRGLGLCLRECGYDRTVTLQIYTHAAEPDDAASRALWACRSLLGWPEGGPGGERVPRAETPSGRMLSEASTRPHP